MKYIFVAGAPGSKWSSVVKNFYYSPSIDRSDYSDERTYHHDASGKMDLMHLGAYYDPGMEFGNFFEQINIYNKEYCEKEFDRPFSSEGVRIIKSHVFSHHIPFLKENWPDCPIVLVHRPNDACLGWWVRCGHFNITYPSYDKYYKDLRHMATIIDKQNEDLMIGWRGMKGQIVPNNRKLAEVLGIEPPPEEYNQEYMNANIMVKVV